MFKTLLLSMMLSLTLVAQSFNFTELRYSDAIGKTIELKGQISFLKNGLEIFYPKTQRALIYEDEELVYEVEGEDVELGMVQSQQIMHYFEVLILLHSGDESALKEMFDVDKNNGFIKLTPKASLKNYIQKIELLKTNEILEYVKLFMQNNDTIMITIDDEIR